MSRPTEAEPSLPTPGPPTGTTLELPSPTPELMDALRVDRYALMREALLWQRWVRVAGLVALVLLAMAFGRGQGGVALLPMAGVSVVYVGCVMLAARAVRRSGMPHGSQLPALLVTADVLAMSAIVWMSGAPAEAMRILVCALLIVQLAVFYFGRSLGAYAAALSGLAYLVVALVLPPQVPGDRPLLAQAAFTFGLFAVTSVVLVSAYGNFRERMNQLRLFCKLVEEGDLSPAIRLGGDTRPDDLTLLARSFDAMRGRLAEQIGTDPLTGCLNRRALETRLRTELRQAKRRGTTVAVLAIDLDHFKVINDTHGHPFGDLVLKELAGIMKATARDTDAVARLGGDEFVVVLPDTGSQGAVTFAERMRRRVDEYRFGAATAATAEPITISIGVALARAEDPIDPDALLQEADRSLYRAKSAGRNRTCA